MSALGGSRLYGYALMAWLALTRWTRFGEPQLRYQLYRQIHTTGIAALPVAGALAALTGAAAVTQLTALAGQNSDVAQSWLFYGLFFELAPLLSGLVLVARSSGSMASELAVMNQHDEFKALRRMGVAPADYLLLPRILGLTLGLPVVTIFFQFVAVVSGWLAVSLLQGLPLLQVTGHFLELADPWLTLLSLLKSAVMGLLIGVIACHHGSSSGRSSRDLPGVAIQAVGNSMVAVFLIDVLVALLVYWIKR
ncbi:MAG: ABC transporter permease [Hylemonella sp.]|nr:ABC transporter permease [Hylemonella sp.]